MKVARYDALIEAPDEDAFLETIRLIEEKLINLRARPASNEEVANHFLIFTLSNCLFSSVNTNVND